MKCQSSKFDFLIDFCVEIWIQSKKFKMVSRASERFEYFRVNNGFFLSGKVCFSFVALYNPKVGYKKVLFILGSSVIFLISFSSFLFQFIFYFLSISPSFSRTRSTSVRKVYWSFCRVKEE